MSKAPEYSWYMDTLTNSAYIKVGDWRDRDGAREFFGEQTDEMFDTMEEMMRVDWVLLKARREMLN